MIDSRVKNTAKKSLCVRGLLLGAVALFATTGFAADYCKGLFKEVDLDGKSKGLIKFLEDKNIETRIVGMERDPDFVKFYGYVEAWMLRGKEAGENSVETAKMVRARQHSLEANLILDEPGMVRIQMKLEDERGFFKRIRGGGEMADTAAVLDAQAIQLALLGKLFNSFGADELKNLKIEWQLPKNAPNGLNKQLAALGFTNGQVTRGCKLKKYGYAGVFLLAGGAAGFYLGQSWDLNRDYGEDHNYDTDDDWELLKAGINGGAIGAGAAGLTAFLMTCRAPTKVSDGYALSFQRLASIPTPKPKAPKAKPAVAAPAVVPPAPAKPATKKPAAKPAVKPAAKAKPAAKKKPATK